MAVFPANFTHGFAVKLQHRVLLISWVKRNNGTSCCAKGRDYSSSVLVRYIPKKSSESEENGAAIMPARCLDKRHNGSELNLTRVDFSYKSSSSVVYVDSKNRGACRASDMNHGLNFEVEEEINGDFMALNDEYIEEPEEIVEDGSKISNGIQSDHSQQAAEKLAIELLASRAFTALELKKKLRAKRFPLEIVDAVITDFQNRGLINDGLYAETYSRSRWSSSSWGPRRIKQALSKKGVSEVDTQKAVKLVFESDEDEEEDSGIAMSKLSIDQLFVQASKQWQRSRDAPQDTRKSRIIRWLQYRGFNWSVIKHVLKKLEAADRS